MDAERAYKKLTSDYFLTFVIGVGSTQSGSGSSSDCRNRDTINADALKIMPWIRTSLQIDDAVKRAN